MHWKVRMGLWSHESSFYQHSGLAQTPFLKGGLAINGLEKTFGSLLPDPDRWTLT